MNSKIKRFLDINADRKMINKGQKLYREGYVQLVDTNDTKGGYAHYQVKSEGNRFFYLVNIGHYKDEIAMTATCTCPYNWGGICKHVAAAVLHLNDLLSRGMQQETSYDMLHSVVSLPDLNDFQLQSLAAPSDWKKRGSLVPAEVISALNGVAECVSEYKKEKYKVRFEKETSGKIITSCSCAQQLNYPLCLHKLASLIAIEEKFGIHAFDVMRDWTVEKNQMLAPYGFTVKDDLTGKFEFKIDRKAQLQMKVLDPSIRSADSLKTWLNSTGTTFNAQPDSLAVLKTNREPTENKSILVFAFKPEDQRSITEIELVALRARYDPVKQKLSHIEKNYVVYGETVYPISEQESELLNIVRRSFQQGSISSAIHQAGQNAPRSWYYTVADLTPESLQAAQTYLGKLWERIFFLLQDRIVVFSAHPNHLVGSMKIVQVHQQPAGLELRLYETADQVLLECRYILNGNTVKPSEVVKHGYWILQRGEDIFRLPDWKHAALAKQFAGTDGIGVRKSLIEPFLSDFVMPLTQYFSIELDIDKPIEYHPLTLSETRIYLKEDEENLLFVPAFCYFTETPEEEVETWEFGLNDEHNKILYEGGQIMVWERDRASERNAKADVQTLHPDFSFQEGSPFFCLSFEKVLQNNWLYEFFEKAQQLDIPVFGLSQLKKFRHNPNRPVIKLRTSSGIDWFDLKMEISFGDQFVSLNDIKKALVKKQNYVQLADGTIGMLPEEWLDKYASILKFGQVKDDSIKVSKLHFSLIDELYDHIDSEKVQQELLEKKAKLLSFKEIKDVELPRNSQAQLRDYQLEGVKWLKFLEEFGWGGCLADDMGLGKTLQVLTFLHLRKESNPKAVHLIVVPTTLIFNWQAEVEKFAPEMRVFVHRGIGRDKNTDNFYQFDLILTTYGTLRTDIESLSAFEFDYVVLDESQAIKNPNALTSKAVKVLRARNRIVMTGTPVENNTFDLYSQMDFVNPGLLGGQDFFRTEFATPIDKHRDEHAARGLRKLIHPFILKRTKEEVAKDLPDKTEMTLFCEMDKKQRKVYDTYRELYRQKIARKMETEGKDKAAFLILEGLMKLRQICDSPALLSDDADYGEESAKLTEIIREIEENAGHHKILIFSQFLKMLDLIKVHLEKVGIPYEYLDGSTQNRAHRVRNFQQSENCRVFLMSLKAGGVGLNLTEADYVYLIDPWWNPAVEQQAIDRTHRIGQTKKVFAYKMICKDTIEEKILQLQEKKKGIAKELISTEEGFIKKLTKEDVIGLFS